MHHTLEIHDLTIKLSNYCVKFTYPSHFMMHNLNDKHSLCSCAFSYVLILDNTLSKLSLYLIM
jgi:uncharacterized protein Veg